MAQKKQVKTNTVKYSALIIVILLLAVGSTLIIAAPRQKNAVNDMLSSGKPAYTIVTTVSMLEDTARNIVGEHAEVRALMGPGVDPHLYLPARSDILQIDGADLVFYIGMLLEGKLSTILDTMAASGKAVYPVSKVINKTELIYPEGISHPDPHIWMDVQLWTQVVEEIYKQVSIFDPEHSSDYYANAESYKESLRALDRSSRVSLANVSQRILITAHDAFNYFGRAYNFEVFGIQGISTESEAGLADINALVRLIIDKKIPAVFFESTVPDKYVRALVEGVKDKGFSLNIGGELFSDSLGPPDTDGNTYIGMINSNVRSITRGLGGTLTAENLQEHEQ